MRGMMMSEQLTLTAILEHAEQNHGASEIVSVDNDRSLHRYTFRDMAARTRRAAQALGRRGVRDGDRVGTLAWNNWRHLELYYAISCMGAICHTLNPRLSAEQIIHIANHAEDGLLCFDPALIRLVEQIAPSLHNVRHFIALCREEELPETSLRDLLFYDSLLAREDDRYTWPRLDERTACSLCYTSGTTGNPKGVLYDHRSQLLHAMAISGADWLAVRARDAILPVVPMFHACAWGLPYVSLMNGAKLVLPGRHLDGASLHQLIHAEGVTMAAAVPTVWQDLLSAVEARGSTFGALDRAAIGGSNAAPSLIRTFEEKYDVRVIHGWGMTELCPVGSLDALKRHMLGWPAERRYAIQSLHGRPLFGIRMRIVDENGTELPHDGLATGYLQVRGLWVAGGYFKQESSGSFTGDGWFNTGDVATIDPDSYMRLMDREKDVIKSGGEWISSIDVESVAMSHESVQEAACIAVPHSRWGERPLLLVVLKQGACFDKAGLLRVFQGRLAKWWIPDDVIVMESLPHSATGKLLKRTLREQFKNHALPGDSRRPHE